MGNNINGFSGDEPVKCMCRDKCPAAQSVFHEEKWESKQAGIDKKK